MSTISASSSSPDTKPWGEEGDAQRDLRAASACALAQRFGAEGFDVAIADVVTPRTAAVYRRHLGGCLLVHLTVTPAEAHGRAATRRMWLTEQGFDLLHRVDTEDPPEADHHLDVTASTPAEQRAAAETLWAATASLDAPWNSPRHGPVTDPSR